VQAITLDSFTTFGDLLKYLRQRERLTQRELGQAVGYGEAQINRLERNTRLPDVSLVAAQFIAALHLQQDPLAAARLIELAAQARGEPVPASLNFTRTTQHKLVEDFSLPHATRRSNLSVQTTQTTSFIGREVEVAELTEQVLRTQLITLTGAGGCGKTRLSLQVAAAVQPAFGDGAWLVELASITDGALVPRAAAAAFGLVDQADASPLKVLTNYLRSKRALLILDNCEHLIEDCAQFAAHLLQHCPHLHLLATSRESLRIAGEVNWRVPSLPQAESVRLFIERACALRSNFEPTDHERAIIATICQQLDGIPLAIELAAARLNMLSPQQIAERLNDRLNLLTSHQRGTTPRHQTLRATIAWSVHLLSEPERDLLMRLSVFVGGFTAEAVEAIGGQTESLDVLSELVDKSLVLTDAGEGVVRYRMLETIRQFAAELLAQADGEHAGVRAARDQHLAYCLQLAERAEPWLQHKDRQLWLDKLAPDFDNVRAALRWCRESHNTDAQLRLASALCWFWNFRGHMTEGREWLEGGLAQTEAQGDTTLRAKAFYAVCSLSWRQGEFALCHAQAKESVRIWRKHYDRSALAKSLAWQTLCATSVEDLNSARTAGEESLALFRELGDDWGRALVLMFLVGALREQVGIGAARAALQESAQASHATGDIWAISNAISSMGRQNFLNGNYAAAQELSEQGAMLRLQAGDQTLAAVSLYIVGHASEQLGDYARATASYRQVVLLNWEIGNITRTLWGMIPLARVFGQMGDMARAVQLLAATQTLDKNGAAQAMQELPLRLDSERARATLGEAAYAEAWARGLAMSLDEAVALALHK
jgi:predicted ATPase/DNA-binding XRE family transcriptional regulator